MPASEHRGGQCPPPKRVPMATRPRWAADRHRAAAPGDAQALPLPAGPPSDGLVVHRDRRRGGPEGPVARPQPTDRLRCDGPGLVPVEPVPPNQLHVPATRASGARSGFTSACAIGARLSDLASAESARTAVMEDRRRHVAFTIVGDDGVESAREEGSWPWGATAVCTGLSSATVRTPCTTPRVARGACCSPRRLRPRPCPVIGAMGRARACVAAAASACTAGAPARCPGGSSRRSLTPSSSITSSESAGSRSPSSKRHNRVPPGQAVSVHVRETCEAPPMSADVER